ncbi:MAG: hypothetical protein U0795_21320 [Pirellulales bacterium]
MDEIRKHVRQARWRLNLQRFGWQLVWGLAACFGLALLAIGARKIWALGGIDPVVWNWSWLGGAACAGFLTAGLMSWMRRRGELEAALEIDRRFQLKERVSSSLMLSDAERSTDFGQALLSDTLRRVERLEVPTEFRLQADRWTLLPLAMAAAAFAVAWLVPDAAMDQTKGQAGAASVAAKQQVKTSVEELQKKLAERAQQAREKKSAEASKLLDELERGVQQLAKREDVDQKKAMIQLNDLAKQLEAKRDQLGGYNELRQQLNQLSDMQQGPAERLANQLKKGDYQAAGKELQRLAQQLKEGKLSEEQKQKLAEQMSQMQKQLDQMMQAREEAKQALKQEIEKKRNSGDLAGAEKMQRQLDQMAKSDQQMAKMAKMSQQMNQAAQALKQGNSQQAQQQMAQLSESMQQMQSEMSELQTLSEALTQLENAKQSMSCSKCSGAGCSLCQGNNPAEGLAQGLSQDGQMMSQNPGQGMGRGRGKGERPESETDTAGFESQVKGQPRQGRSVITGTVAGPNVQGDVRLDIRESLEQATAAQEDPLEGLHLPREQREIAREYYHIRREGLPVQTN